MRFSCAWRRIRRRLEAYYGPTYCPESRSKPKSFLNDKSPSFRSDCALGQDLIRPPTEWPKTSFPVLVALQQLSKTKIAEITHPPGTYGQTEPNVRYADSNPRPVDGKMNSIFPSRLKPNKYEFSGGTATNHVTRSSTRPPSPGPLQKPGFRRLPGEHRSGYRKRNTGQVLRIEYQWACKLSTRSCWAGPE